MTRETFTELVSRDALILDGAMGTNLFRSGMPRGVCPEAWTLEHPEVVEELQRGYVDAGTQILYSPTFGANRSRLREFELDGETARMNRELVALSKRAADGRAYVAGDLAPSGLVLEANGGTDSIDEVFDVYREQAEILSEAGVDCFVIETMMSVDEATVALDAVLSVTEMPVLVTMSVQADGMAYYGGSLYDAAAVFEAMGASAVGVNCCSGPDQLVSMVKTLSETVSVPVIAKPNAGLPFIDEETGLATYDMEPAAFARHMRALREAGGSLLGGCCGTTPAYIRAMVRELRGELIRP